MRKAYRSINMVIHFGCKAKKWVRTLLMSRWCWILVQVVIVKCDRCLPISLVRRPVIKNDINVIFKVAPTQQFVTQYIVSGPHWVFSMKMAFLKCFVHPYERFHEIEAQHISLVIDHIMNICDNWASWNSISDAYNKLFFGPLIFFISEGLNTAH